MTLPRQTLSFLRTRFREVGINPTNKFGQNFLIDLNLVEMLVSSAEIDQHDVVLEVGTGTGSLTGMMAARAGAVVTVEIDPQLHAMASEELAEFDNVTMLHQDALKNKNNLHPHVIATVEEQLAKVDGGRFKLVANLPYNIATPILSNLLSTPVRPVSHGSHDSKRACRADHCPAELERLRSAQHLDAKPMQRRDRTNHATERVLARDRKSTVPSYESILVTRSGHGSKTPTSFISSCDRCSSTAASFSEPMS